MRTKTQDRRLLKLIRFLEKLLPEKFDFRAEVSKAHTNHVKCATVACAIGWTPEVFPGLVQWKFREFDNDKMYSSALFEGFVLNTGVTANYYKTAQFLFGVEREHDIFFPGNQKYTHEGLPYCGGDAKPFAVAQMLRKYRKLFPITQSKT